MRTFLPSSLVAAVAATLITPSAAAASPTASDVLSVRDRAAGSGFGARAEWTATTYYLQGAIEAFATANSKGAQRLFCPPERKSYSIDEMIAFLERAPERDRATPALTVILEGYRSKHPC